MRKDITLESAAQTLNLHLLNKAHEILNDFVQQCPV